MVFTSIKVREEDKRVFDRLRHEFALQAGEDLSQHELFHRIIQHAMENKPSVLGGPRRTRPGSWTKFQFDLGAPTDAVHDVDRVVYGLDE